MLKHGATFIRQRQHRTMLWPVPGVRELAVNILRPALAEERCVSAPFIVARALAGPPILCGVAILAITHAITQPSDRCALVTRPLRPKPYAVT